jgi:hypothetical protein
MREQFSLGFEEPTPARARKRRAWHHQSHHTVQEAQAGERKARGQEAVILGLFQGRPSLRLTPWQLCEELSGLGHKMLITSVRRSLTNLTDRGLLRRHDEDRRPGEAGALNATWGLA